MKKLYFCNVKKSSLICFVLASTLPLGAQNVTHSQYFIDAPSGEYSGICHVEGSVFAVVHDKAKGGGLYSFVLSFQEDGSIALQNCFQLRGTENGGPSKDSEDVVYADGKLWVAAEADQSIREYNTDGTPTGRSLRIPKDMQKTAANRGFESLAFDGTRFWTTTEIPLSGQKEHIIQSFSLRTLSPAGRYLYRADDPTVSSSVSSSALAYVHGISAITALPDGRLAVLEREVYVPKGGFFQKMASSFTESRIYVVDPSASKKGTLLEKELITSFTTGAVNFANYEGMCVVPQELIPGLDPSRTALLLIADSQNGGGGLTGEYLMLVTF